MGLPPLEFGPRGVLGKNERQASSRYSTFLPRMKSF